jgi:hypothetical protein
MTKYDFDPPYGVIQERLCAGEVIPFLGTGASMQSACDVWDKCLARPIPPDANPPCYAPGRCAGFNPAPLATSCPPKTNELACYLARLASFPDGESIDLAKVAQYFGAATGRAQLYRELHKVFNYDYPFNSLHELLTEVTAPLLIVTTNYDDLIERAFDAKGRAYDLIIHTTTPDMGSYILWQPHGATPQRIVPNKLNLDIKKTTVIYKMHGTVDRKNNRFNQFVISEDDYVNFLTRMMDSKVLPAVCAEPFQTRPFLFLGYSLRDWNLRVVLNQIEKSLRPRRDKNKSWAIQHPVSPLENLFWQEKGINVYDRTIEQFVTELRRAGGSLTPLCP